MHAKHVDGRCLYVHASASPARCLAWLGVGVGMGWISACCMGLRVMCYYAKCMQPYQWCLHMMLSECMCSTHVWAVDLCHAAMADDE